MHRIGRTGRAGNSGKAFSLVANDDDKTAISAIEKLIGKTIPTADSGNTGKTSSKKPNKSAEDTTKAETANATKTGTTESGITKTDEQDTAKTDAKSSPRRKKPTRYEGERDAPPDCSGSNFKDTEHTPAFLLKQTA